MSGETTYNIHMFVSFKCEEKSTKGQCKLNKIQQKRYFIRLRDGDKSLTFIEIFVGRESSTFTTYNIPNSFNGVSSYFNKISCSGSKWISM